MRHCPTLQPVRRSEAAAAALSACAMAGIFFVSVACITRTAPPPAAPVEMAAMPQPVEYQPPVVHRTAGPWVRRRLGYTALSYQMPDLPEVLQVDDDHTEIARVARDGGRVRYEIKSFEHETVALNNVHQLLDGALTEIARRVGGVRRNQTALTQGGYPGVDLTYDFPQTGATLRVRMLVGRTRSYAALVAYPTHADAYLREDVERFQGGLEFDEGDLPEADGDGAFGPLRYVEPVGAWFAAQMPGSPRREAQTLTLPELTRPRITYTVGASGAEERYVVAVTTFDRGVPDATLAGVVSALTAAGWRVRDERPVTTQGYAGRAYTLDRSRDTALLQLRVFVTRSRVYEFMAKHPATSDDASAARLRGFFDSLRIL